MVPTAPCPRDKAQELPHAPGKGQEHARVGEEKQRLRIHNPEPCAGPSSFPPYSQQWFPSYSHGHSSHPCAHPTSARPNKPPGAHTSPTHIPIWPNWSQSLLQLSPPAVQGCDSTASQPGPSTSSHKSVTDQSMGIPKGSISIKQGALG